MLEITFLDIQIGGLRLLKENCLQFLGRGYAGSFGKKFVGWFGLLHQKHRVIEITALCPGK